MCSVVCLYVCVCVLVCPGVLFVSVCLHAISMRILKSAFHKSTVDGTLTAIRSRCSLCISKLYSLPFGQKCHKVKFCQTVEVHHLLCEYAATHVAVDLQCRPL